MVSEEISLFDELDLIEREDEAQSSFQSMSLDEKEQELRYCQNGLWLVYKAMLTFYQFPTHGVTLTPPCIDWKDRELRRYGDFKKEREVYKEVFRKIDTYIAIQEKLFELKDVMNKGPYIYVTDHLERRILRAISSKTKSA
ncbi:TPA: hypothetical protein ACGOR8_001973 [Streptococcus suis]